MVKRTIAFLFLGLLSLVGCSTGAHQGATVACASSSEEPVAGVNYWPDSSIAYPALWTIGGPNSGAWSPQKKGPKGAAAWQLSARANGGAVGNGYVVAPDMASLSQGQRWTISAWVDASKVTQGSLSVSVYDPTLMVEYGKLHIRHGSGPKRYFSQPFSAPTCALSAKVVFHANNVTIAPNEAALFSQPQLQISPGTKYIPSRFPQTHVR